MPRSRRFAAVAVLALLGALALAGCGKAQPGTAAYVGDNRYTERQLDELVAEMRGQDSEQQSDVRTWALTHLILLDLARRAADAQDIAVPDAEYDEFAQRIGLPPSAKLVRLGAEYEAIRGALATKALPVSPVDADFREIWETLRKDPRLRSDVTYDKAVEILRRDQSLPLILGVRNLLRDQAAKTKVVVNPVYHPLVGTVATTSSEAAVTMLLGADAGFVTDLASG